MTLLRWLFMPMLLAVAILAGADRGYSQNGTNQAAVVVKLGEYAIETRCVSFSEPTISGYEALTRSGLAVTTSTGAVGSAVCQIEDTGCPANDCFCRCRGGADCEYWSYWHLADGEWRYGQLGAAAFQVANGDVEGWSWGPGAVDLAVAPPLTAFSEICTESGSEAVLEDSAVLAGHAPEVAQTETRAEATERIETATDRSYLAFGVIVVGLLGAAWWLRRRATS